MATDYPYTVPEFDATIYEGSDVSIGLTITQSGSAVDLADYTTFTAELRDLPGGTSIGTGTVTVDDAANGQITVAFGKSLTASIGSRWSFDVFAYNPSGDWVPLVRSVKNSKVKRVTEAQP